MEPLRVTHLGISPRWLYEYQRANISPRKMADLSPLQVVTSTGMVLPDSLFEWFYDEGFPATVRLNNISGGTDIAGCFGISNALVPVHTGGCAGFSLGIDVQVYDSTIEGDEGVKGTPIEDGVPGELVATSAFPNMPSYFWGDSGGQKYRQAYFSRFDSKLPYNRVSFCGYRNLTPPSRCMDAWGLCVHPPHHKTAYVPWPSRWGVESLRGTIRLG